MKPNPRKIMLMLLPAAAVAIWVAQATASGVQGDAPAREASRTEKAADARDIRVSRLLGMRVDDSAGHRIGEVSDLIVDTDSLKVRYAIVDAGGFLGLGEHRTAVPIAKVSAAHDKDRIVVDMSEEQLRSFPSYPPDRGPDWSDAAFRAKVDGAAAPPPAQERHGFASGHRFRRASDLLDAELRDRGGRDIGDVEDIVISLRTGAVQYGVASFDAPWPNPGKLVMVTPEDVRAADGEGDDLVVVADAEKLRSAPPFSQDDWPEDERGFMDRLLGRGRDREGGAG